jgi:tetraacyldisaccharide 4'-kinase
MKLLRKLLFPFSIMYGLITRIRNFLFDKGYLKSTSFTIPIIAVGNLSVGGTGKTPQIEYLIRLLYKNYKIATLSRGYKRKSKGYFLANENATASILGDEPFQFHQKFPEIVVAVDENRTNGIQQLLSLENKPEVILLDDAFQHRKVKAGFYILLTAYNDLYANDFILPAGNLRESRKGAKRADIIIVTKCPENLSTNEQNSIKNKLKLAIHQQLYFTFIVYDDFIYSKNNKISLNEIKTSSKLIIAGIAKPEPFFDYLKSNDDECVAFPDHHDFTENDLVEITKKAKGKIIITTEKDYVRLQEKLKVDTLFYLPIKSSFIDNKEDFNKKIIDYVGRSARNR